MRDKRVKRKWILVFSVVFLLILAAVFAIYIPIRNKAKAPVTETVSDANSNPSEGTGIISGVSQAGQSNQVDQKSPAPNDNGASNPATNDQLPSTQTSTATADTYYSQGLDQLNSQQYEKAIESFSQAIKQNPNKSDYYQKKAEAEIKLGRKQDAIATYKAGIAANPNDFLLQDELNYLESSNS